MLAANSVHIINDYVFSHKSSTLSPSLTLKGGSQRGNKDEILDCIVTADPVFAVMTAAMLGGTVPTSIFRPEGVDDFSTDVFVPIYSKEAVEFLSEFSQQLLDLGLWNFVYTFR